MAQPKFKVGERVKVLINDIQPEYIGQWVKVKKVFPITNEEHDTQFVYRLEYFGKTLRGVTMECDLDSDSRCPYLQTQ